MTYLNSVPSKMSSTRFNQPWITNHIKRLSKRKQRSFNKAHSTNLPKDWIVLRKNHEVHVKKPTIVTYVTKFLDVKDGNSKKLSSFVKSKCKSQCGIPSQALQHNGQSLC